MANFIPADLYSQILEHMPVPCVDFVLVQNGKVLLTYRTEEPAKDRWWIQGGRMYKNERLQEAVFRLAEREIGTRNIRIIKQFGAYEFFSKTAPFDVKSGIHDVAIVFLAEPLEANFTPRLDKTHKKFRWIESIEKDLDPYVKKALEDSGVFEK